MKKKARIYIRATSEEKRELKKRAKESGLTLTEWLMKRCFDGIVVEEEKNNE